MARHLKAFSYEIYLCFAPFPWWYCLMCFVLVTIYKKVCQKLQYPQRGVLLWKSSVLLSLSASVIAFVQTWTSTKCDDLLLVWNPICIEYNASQGCLPKCVVWLRSLKEAQTMHCLPYHTISFTVLHDLYGTHHTNNAISSFSCW